MLSYIITNCNLNLMGIANSILQILSNSQQYERDITRLQNNIEIVMKWMQILLVDRTNDNMSLNDLIFQLHTGSTEGPLLMVQEFKNPNFKLQNMSYIT